MVNGHLVYIGDHKKLFLKTFQSEINSFVSIQQVNLKIWDHDKIIELLESKFDSSVIKAYNSLVPYALKADLARLCILYEHGGFYSDFGIKLIDKINTNGYDLVLFSDEAIKKVYGLDRAIQVALMFATPKNLVIKKAIDKMVQTYTNREYGDNPMFVGGEVHLANALFESEGANAYIGKFGNNFIDLDKLLSGKTILEYHQDRLVAFFKDLSQTEALKDLDGYKTNYVSAWFNKKIYKTFDA